MSENSKLKNFDYKKIVYILFYIALTIEIIIVILDKSAYIIQYESYWFRLTFVLFGIKVLFTRYSIKEWIAMILFGILGCISYFVTGRNEIIRIVMFIAACKDLDIRKLIKYTFYTTLAGCLILVVLSFFGFGVVSITAKFRFDDIQTRYCLGMGHPNALHCMFWALLTLYLYLYGKKLKWYHYAVLMGLNILLYVFTDSRAGIIISSITIIAALLVTQFGKIRDGKAIYILGIIAIIGCVLLTAVLLNASFYDKYFAGLDRMLTNRIRFALVIENMQIQDWTLFGLRANQQYTDMGYAKMIYWYGIIPSLVYVAMCIRLVWLSRKTKDCMAALITVLISIYTIFEAHDVSVYLARNYVLFFFGIYWNKMLYVESKNKYYIFDIFRIKKLAKQNG